MISTTCEVCGRPQATTESAEHPDDGLCWARRFYGGHDAGEMLNALRTARGERDALAAEVARRGELLAAERERYVLLQGTLDAERGASGERSVAHMEEVARLSAEVARLTKLLDGLAEHAARGSRAALEAAMVAIYDDWRARMAAAAKAASEARRT
jgi:hypothetical protein